MYSQLSGNQQAVLDSGKCPHCFQIGTVEEQQTRNGPTVVCTNCNKKIYRPRGRAVSQLDGLAGGASGVAQREQTANGNANGEQTSQENPGEHSHDSQSTNDNGEQAPPCPKCNGEMKKRSGKYGEFFGCSNYPKCDGTAKVKNPSQGSQQNAQQNAGKIGSEAIGKPMSQAAQEALNKIQAALQAAMQNELQKEMNKLQQEKEKAAKELADKLKSEVEALKPSQLEVTVKDATTQQTTVNVVADAHPMLDEIIRRYRAGIRNFLLIGPSGSCKSTIAKQLAKALGFPYSMTPWSGGTTEAAILGRLSGDGQYLPSAFVTWFEMAGVHNWDEIDRADPNVPLCANSAIENGDIFLPARVHSQHAIRNPDNILIATANNMGGADMMYVGSNQQDAALKSRFAGGIFWVDYDLKLEKKLVPEDSLRVPFWTIRQNVQQHKLRRIWGTRELLRGRLLLLAGYTVAEIFEALTVGWTPDEKQKVGL